MDLICSVELVQVIWCCFMYLKGKLAMPAEVPWQGWNDKYFSTLCCFPGARKQYLAWHWTLCGDWGCEMRSMSDHIQHTGIHHALQRVAFKFIRVSGRRPRNWKTSSSSHGFGTHSESMRGRGRNKSAGLVILPFYGGVNLQSKYTLRAGRLIKIIKFLLHRFANSCKLLSIMADQDPQTRAVW